MLGLLSERHPRGIVAASSGQITAISLAGPGHPTDPHALQVVGAGVVGLPADCTEQFRGLADLVLDKQEDFSVVHDLLATTSGPALTSLLRLFADLGLVVPGDPVRECVALTPLGRLVAQSLSRP